MERARFSITWSKHNLPEDLWSEILSRLPVKSLLWFRCVSKIWQSLIDDPNFCHLHLNQFKNNINKTNLFVVQRHKYTFEESCVVRCNNTFRSTVRLSSLDISGLGNDWWVLCSMDGLVMLLYYYAQSFELVLWNPSIRRVRALPPSLGTASKGVIALDLGFGFSPFIKDYKHIQLHRDQSGDLLHSVAVYTFGTHSWTTIQFQGKGEGCSSWHWNFNGTYERKTLCLKGILYFIATDIVSDNKDLVTFDLSSEVFASTSLPVHGDMKNSNELTHLTLMLVDGGCSLGVVNVHRMQGSIWVLASSGTDIDSVCWTKRYTFTATMREIGLSKVSWPKFLYLKENGDMILQWHRQVTLYNLESNEEKTLLKNSRRLDMSMVCGYIESLVLLKG